MARTILRIGAAVWLVAGVAGLGLAVVGAEWLLGLLPPLTIDAAALARAVATLSAGLGAVGLAHLGALRALRGGGSGPTAAILLSSFLGVAFLTLSAAAITSAVAQPRAAAALLAGSVGALMAAGGYGVAVARLVREMRVRRPL
jgi:hypothetical protein